MGLTKYAKDEIGKLMLHRGHSFLKSAVLLKRSGGSKDVELYNICQGVEVILKSFLLLKNYDMYKPLLPKKNILGHDLVKLVDAVVSEYKIKALSKEELQELEILNNYYTNHYLRYSGVHDIFFPSTKIGYGLVARKIVAGIKLADKEIAKNKI